jgi:hypothetical protein
MFMEEGLLFSCTIERSRLEKRSRSANRRISDMETIQISVPKSILIPVKGRKTDFLVDLEELMYVFPCT